MTIPLQSAYLCTDCDHIGDNAVRCEQCASESLLSLANVLNRKEETNATDLRPIA
jgi:hypothetical protein